MTTDDDSSTPATATWADADRWLDPPRPPYVPLTTPLPCGSTAARAAAGRVDTVRDVLDGDHRTVFSPEHAVQAAWAARQAGLREREVPVLLRALARDDLDGLRDALAHARGHTDLSDAAGTALAEVALLPDPDAETTATALMLAGHLLRIAAPGADDEDEHEGRSRVEIVAGLVRAALDDGDVDLWPGCSEYGSAAYALALAARHTTGEPFMLLAEAIDALPPVPPTAY